MFGNSSILKNFIVFESLDGAGTTTQLALLKEKLSAAEIPHHLTFEPSDSAIGKLIRSIMFREVQAEKDTLARLFAADRSEHLYGSGGIQQHIHAGNLVICDRYFLSSLAYQGPDVGLEQVWKYNSDFPLPEHLFFFDLDAEAGFKRYGEREKLDMYENIEVQISVRKRYHALVEELEKTPVQVHRIDSSLSIEEISMQLWRIISNIPIDTM